MLKSLGHPVRLGIVRALAAQPETCACDFTELFAVSQPTISQHLKVLREAACGEHTAPWCADLLLGAAGGHRRAA